MLYERWETLVFSWLTISLIAIVGAVALHESRPFSALASLAFGLLCLGLALRMFVRSRRAPLIILSRSGLAIALLDAPIAW